ncbi:unnamed protein product [Lactuca saligna]|uniref:Uncharacterized protein n=1 Tax=Lactuca saligna TaxID=75948 RepID=A0AA35ZG50_LACSI|nr:unnamed protein product [Lactuca saligna]
MVPYENVKIVFRALTVLLWLGTCMAETLSANFVFGDSLVEVGNNNYIVSLSKANYIPNGIDFGMPTGRYTNGRTIVDILGEELGLKDYTPPYLAPRTSGPLLLRGVNYASGGGGIVNETGKIFGGRINMDAQLDNFANTKQDIISRIGATATQELLSGALFSVTIGSNDFINNYLTPVVSTIERKLVSPEAFVGTLISRFRLQLMRLYDLGARKIVIPNVGPIGCIPYQRDVNPSEGNDCVALANHLAQLYNRQLKSLLEELNIKLKGSTFLFADVYNIVADIIQNFESYGGVSLVEVGVRALVEAGVRGLGVASRKVISRRRSAAVDYAFEEDVVDLRRSGELGVMDTYSVHPSVPEDSLLAVQNLVSEKEASAKRFTLQYDQFTIEVSRRKILEDDLVWVIQKGVVSVVDRVFESSEFALGIHRVKATLAFIEMDFASYLHLGELDLADLHQLCSEEEDHVPNGGVGALSRLNLTRVNFRCVINLVGYQQRITESPELFRADFLCQSEACKKCFILCIVVRNLKVESQGICYFISLGVFEYWSCV